MRHSSLSCFLFRLSTSRLACQSGWDAHTGARSSSKLALPLAEFESPKRAGGEAVLLATTLSCGYSVCMYVCMCVCISCLLCERSARYRFFARYDAFTHEAQKLITSFENVSYRNMHTYIHKVCTTHRRITYTCDMHAHVTYLCRSRHVSQSLRCQTRFVHALSAL